MDQSITLQQIQAAIGGEIRGDASTTVTSVAALTSAQEGQLSFLSNSKFKDALATTKASIVIMQAKDAENVSNAALIHQNPYAAYAQIAQLLDTTPAIANGIHPSAVIHETALIGNNVSVAANAVIDAFAVIGDNTHIGASSHIGCYAQLGDNVKIRSNVSIYHGVELGSKVSIHSGTVIGSDGFGYANDKGEWIKIPQLGIVVVGQDTEIGANCCIDRGTLDNTVIGKNVIIDNAVHIAHNVTIGDHTCICGQTGIAGSSTIGKYVVIAGGCAINGHISICDKVQITGVSMVTKSITQPGTYSSGMPAVPNKQWARNTVRLQQVETLHNRIKALEQNR